MAEIFLWRAVQGGTLGETVDFSGGSFAGTETLAGLIHKGDGQAAILTFTPSWNTATTGLVDCALTAANLDTLGPGSFLVDITVAGATGAVGRLDVFSGAGASTVLRTLATPADAIALLPGITGVVASFDALPLALVRATRAIEGYCQRTLVLSDFDHWITPQNTAKLRLRTRPVPVLTRLGYNIVPGLTITNTGASTTAASVAIKVATQGGAAIASLTMASTVAGVTTTSSALATATYTTFTTLGAAVSALGNGWSATVSNIYGDYATADAYGSPGIRGALNRTVEIDTTASTLTDYELDSDRGVVTVYEYIPGNYAIRNPRIDRSDQRRFGVRCTYRGGYATAQADLALGYTGVPEDLATACVMTAQAILEHTPQAGPVKQQSVKDRSYQLKDELALIPEAARGLLARYRSLVI